jgi:hypothetical protein
MANQMIVIVINIKNEFNVLDKLNLVAITKLALFGKAHNPKFAFDMKEMALCSSLG